MKSRLIRKNFFVVLVLMVLVGLVVAFLEYETVCAGNQALDNRHCTMVVIGKDGTADGSTILWHNEELPGNVAGRLVIVPRRNHQPGEMRPCGYEMITQVPVTFRHIGHRYYEGCYPPSTSDWSMGCNQFGVSVLCNAMNSKEYLLPPSTGVAYCDMTEVPMERARTSREAVEIFTSLIDEYGIGGDWPNCAWVFGDANEVWYVETGVRHWVARKVRNDEILPISNRYNIGTEWDLASDDLIEYAVAQGWYDPDSGEPFSWKDVYGVPGRQNNTWLIRREARIMDMLSPKWGVITPRDLFELSRDHWEGTSFYHYPPHEASSPICSRSSNFGMVFQLRAWLPTEIGTLMWYRMGAPCSSVYIPIYLGTMEFPEVYTMDVTSGYDPESAWWHFKMLMNYVDQDYENRNPIIRRTWSHFETEELNHTHLLEIEALMAYQQGEIEYMRNILTEYTSQKLMDAYLDTDGDGIPDSYDYNPGQDNLVAHWTFDDDVKDSSGNGYHGTIIGAPIYVDGRVGKALDFDGIDDCVTIPGLTNPVNMTYALWVKADSYSGSWDTLLEFGGDDPWFGIYQAGKIDFYPYVTSSRSITIGQWYHIAVTSNGSESIIYINGQADATGMPNTRTGTGLGIGHNVWPKHFDGLIDDVRIYSRALSAEEILQLYREGFNPNPADGATGVDIDTLLSWSPGTYATSHDVYFCTDWDDVNNANTNSAEYMGISDVNSFDPGGLDANTTYYWRIDEVNEGDPYSPYKGEVWTFSTNMTVYVPSDYPTIQQAIDAAWDGVAIIVEQGRYYENINFKGKYLTLTSTDPNDPNIVANTIIDGNEQGSVVTFSGGEDGNSVLSGFTITDGKFSYGGGIYCSHNSPTITKCNITGNSARGGISYARGSGGGIYCRDDSSPTITNCNITSNYARGSGGGIYCRDDSSPTITNCTFTGNSSDEGGGMFNYYNSPTLTNCNIVDNSADGGGGMYNTSSSPTVTNCILWGNTAPSGPQIYNDGTSSATVSYSDVQGGWPGEGNIDADPLFVGPGYSIQDAISHWELDEGGGDVAYDSAGENHGMLMNGPQWTTGQIDGALDFDGADDYAAIQNLYYDSEGEIDEITVCAWVKSTSSNRQIIASFDRNEYWRLSLVDDMGTRNVGWDTTDSGGATNDFGTSAGYADGDWHYICGWFKAGASPDKKIFVDGNLIASTTAHGGRRLGTGTKRYGFIAVGSEASSFNGSKGPYYFFNGAIDDVRITQRLYQSEMYNCHLLPGSPCIDAGDNTAVPADITDLDGDGNTTEPLPFDLDGNPRFVDRPDIEDTGNGTPPIVDMGAYEVVPPPLEVPMHFTPQALNPGSEGKWLKAHIVLPEGFGVEDVDVNTPAVIEPVGIESEYINAFVNEDGLVELEIGFSRRAFCEVGIDYGPAEVRVVGRFTDGQYFVGSDIIRIITNNLKYLAVLASHWLEAGCGVPDYCGGADIDRNSVVDFVDFVLLDGCCIEVIKE